MLLHRKTTRIDLNSDVDSLALTSQGAANECRTNDLFVTYGLSTTRRISQMRATIHCLRHQHGRSCRHLFPGQRRSAICPGHDGCRLGWRARQTRPGLPRRRILGRTTRGIDEGTMRAWQAGIISIGTSLPTTVSPTATAGGAGGRCWGFLLDTVGRMLYYTC